jgi:lysophospholipase L1-like esterase
VAPEKPAGVRRIALLGDSVAFGAGVAAGAELPAQLAARLAGAAPPTEVLNLAVPGYDTLDEVAFLEAVGLPLAPDVVVLAYCINDAGVQSLNAALIRLLHEQGALLRHSRLAQLVLGRLDRAMLRREARLANDEQEFRRRYEGRIAPLDDDPPQRTRIAALAAALAEGPPPSRFLPWYASEARVGRLRFALAHLRDLAAARGFAVVVALVPFLDEGGRPELFAQARAIVAHEARRQGFRVVDLHRPLARAGMERLLGSEAGRPDPLHPNAQGHRLMAEALAAELR